VFSTSISTLQAGFSAHETAAFWPLIARLALASGRYLPAYLVGRERCGESGTIDGHPVEMLGLIAIPARDANCPLEGANSTLGANRNDLRYLVAQKVLQSAKLG
jgi:hypothetical protein